MSTALAKYSAGILVVLVGIAVGLIVFEYQTSRRSKELTVSFLDVGQGDATFIETPNNTQILVDGGRGIAVLARLSEVLPFFDRSIDLVIATHPDEDHIGGLVDVLTHYSVDRYITTQLTAETNTFETLNRILNEQAIDTVYASRGMRVHLDRANGIYFEILFPSFNVSRVRDKNDASVIGRLVYGETEFMLTGDAGKRIEERLARQVPSSYLESDILKIGHHGSDTSSSIAFLDVISPELGVISAGCDNRYGHPDKDVLQRLALGNIQSISTCEYGTIVMKSDGRKITIDAR